MTVSLKPTPASPGPALANTDGTGESDGWWWHGDKLSTRISTLILVSAPSVLPQGDRKALQSIQGPDRRAAPVLVAPDLVWGFREWKSSLCQLLVA